MTTIDTTSEWSYPTHDLGLHQLIRHHSEIATVIAAVNAIPLHPPTRWLAPDYAFDSQQLITLGVPSNYDVPHLQPCLPPSQVNLTITQGGLHRWADDSHRGQTEHPPSLPGCVPATRQ